ncbi:hypothetical protein [Yokenella regensburgei]|uniref:hypothetical protein n=1 Tax=Yokenella regensburgei TaxID=158877 RepID=UPI003F5CCABF
MLKHLLQTLKMGYVKAFDCYGRDTKLEYLTILSFQQCWFAFYLWQPYTSDYSLIIFLLFILPVASSNARCIRYCGYSRALCLLWFIAPYVLLFLPFILKKRQVTPLTP